MSVSKLNAVERLRRRISDRLDADTDKPRGYRKTQRGLAAKIGISEATLSELLNGPASRRGLLAHLDKIAAYFGVPPSLLVHANDTALMELLPGEHRLLQHWRQWPPDTQDAVMAVLDYVAGLLPEEKEERRWWVKIRRLKRPQDRQLLEDYLGRLLHAQRIDGRSTGARENPPAQDSPATDGLRAAPRRTRAGEDDVSERA